MMSAVHGEFVGGAKNGKLTKGASLTGKAGDRRHSTSVETRPKTCCFTPDPQDFGPQNLSAGADQESLTGQTLCSLIKQSTGTETN